MPHRWSDFNLDWDSVFFFAKFESCLNHVSVYILGVITAAVVVCSVCTYSTFKCRRETVVNLS